MRWFAAVLYLAVISVAHAQSSPTPRTFVDHVYARYTHDKAGLANMVNGNDASQVFSPSLLTLIKRDKERAGKGYVGALDFDPVCSCQDSGGMRVIGVEIATRSPTQALATVRLHFPEPTTLVIHLKLILTGQGWRINNISTSSVLDLRKLLQ